MTKQVKWLAISVLAIAILLAVILVGNSILLMSGNEDFTLRVIFTGLQLFVPISGKHDDVGMWVLLAHADERKAGEHFPHYPMLRIGCNSTGQKCRDYIPLDKKEVFLEGFGASGALEVEDDGFSEKIVPLNKLGVGPVLGELVELPGVGDGDFEGHVFARMWLTGGKVRTGDDDGCQWALAPVGSDPKTLEYNRSMALRVVFEVDLEGPTDLLFSGLGDKHRKIIESLEIDSTNELFKRPWSWNSDVVTLWVTNDPALVNWDRHLKGLGHLPHFQMFKKLHDGSVQGQLKIPFRDPVCSAKSVGGGPIICPGARSDG